MRKKEKAIIATSSLPAVAYYAWVSNLARHARLLDRFMKDREFARKLEEKNPRLFEALNKAALLLRDSGRRPYFRAKRFALYGAPSLLLPAAAYLLLKLRNRRRQRG